jgi:hypothetical protein
MPTQLNILCQIPRLHLAWNTVKAKGSAGGIDGMTIIEFEKEIILRQAKLLAKAFEETDKFKPYVAKW